MSDVQEGVQGHRLIRERGNTIHVTVDEEKVTADVRFTPLTLSDLLEN